MKEKPFKKLIAVAISFLMLSCGTDYGKFSIFASEFDEPENYPPSVLGIPGESIDEGKKFAPIKLNKYVTDEDNANAIKWSVSGNKDLKVSISADHIATIEIPDQYWNGSEDITFIATDTKGAEGSETVRFTVNSVNNPPEVQKIPDQTVNEGSTFARIRLDDYVTDPDHPKNKIRWTCKITPIGTDQSIGDLTVEIDPNRVATVIIPDANWYGSAKIGFMASDPEGASASTTANFVVNPVNDAPIVQKIPNQIIDEKNEFEPISLTDYVADVDDDVTKLKWNISGNKDLIVSISDECIATIKTPNQYWTGSEDVTFTVSDPAGASAEATVKFIVKPGITVAPTDHGTVTVNDNAFEGETVKLTVTPDTGYVVKSVIANDGTVYVTVNSDGTYSFTMPAEHVTVTAEFKRVYSDGIGEHLAGHSLSLNGNIGVNFYMELDADVIADPDAYMLFTLPNDTTQTVKVIDATVDTTTVSGKTYYVFQCSVAAKEMTDTIKAQMFSGEKQGEEYSYTVKQYADYLFANAYEADGTTVKNQAYVDAIELIKSMVNYGAYSQLYFNHNIDSLANEDITATDVRNVTAETVNKTYDGSTNTLPDGVTLAGANLELESETVMNLYFTNTTGKALTFTTSGNVALMQEQSGEYTKVTITGIAAQYLDSDVTVNVALEGDDNAYSVKYSPMNYCYNVLARETTATRTEALKNVMRAFYLYNKEAKAYFASHNN